MKRRRPGAGRGGRGGAPPPPAAGGENATVDEAAGAAPAAATPVVVAGSVLAVTLALLSVCCAVGAIVLHRYVIDRTSQPVGLMAEDVVMATAFPLVAALLLLYQPRNRVGWVLLSTALTGPYLLATQYAALALVPGKDGLPLQEAATWFAVWGYVPYLVLWGLVPPLFPDGRLPSRRWRWVVGAIAVIIAGHLLVRMFSPTATDVSAELANPLGVEGARWLLYSTLYSSVAAILGGGLVGLAAVVTRLRRSAGQERARLQWLVAGVAGLIGAPLVGVVLEDGSTRDGASIGISMGTGMALLIAAIGVGAVRHHLFDIGTALSRTVVYGLLTAFLLVAYAATVAAAGAIMPGHRVAYAVLAVAALVAAAARDQVQRVVDRLLFGTGRDPYAMLAVLGGRLDLATGPMDALTQLAEGTRRALKLPYIAALAIDERLPVVEAGGPVEAVERLPLLARTRPVGTLVVGRRHPADLFTDAERAILDDVARRAGDLLDAAALQHDLRRSRDRLVVAREEERRRLRRDLHDGIGPQLAAMAMQLDLLADGLEERADPAAARAALLRDRLRDTVRDIRHVVEDLRPPALDEGGLAVALAQVVAPFAPVVAFEAPAGLADVALPAATEVAAYRIVAEAVTNAVRHSGCERCVVHVRPEAPWLVIEVSDDGTGLAADAVPGVGLQSIRERASEVGGRLEVLTPRARQRVSPQGQDSAPAAPLMPDTIGPDAGRDGLAARRAARPSPPGTASDAPGQPGTAGAAGGGTLVRARLPLDPA
ncbi:sensor histidine kinase [Frankia sp. CN6]|uniref:Sensor histidine kinase n=1 Tax=Frankia nepalensis TaxID=1836974 RepID=A0A937UPG8_9ACTN|nr:GAF domain-containing sensor histidine kinase [Frankia nepalensis]MBL7627255.1 sensor histidine kinase [Frankia nepalensis]